MKKMWHINHEKVSRIYIYIYILRSHLNNLMLIQTDIDMIVNCYLKFFFANQMINFQSDNKTSFRTFTGMDALSGGIICVKKGNKLGKYINEAKGIMAITSGKILMKQEKGNCS